MKRNSQDIQTQASRRQGTVQKFFNKIAQGAKNKPLVFLFIIAMIAGGITLIGADASGGDCSANDIIKCGGFSGKSGVTPSQSQLNANVAEYHEVTEIDNIYKHYGIDRKNLGGLPLGEVHANGNITLNGEIVATGARSSGRQNISNSKGSSKKITANGTVFYERSTTVSFRSGKLQAWIKLDGNGRFLWAVISGCGNPVVASPTKPEPSVGKVTCTAITQQKLTRDKYRFTVTGAAAGDAKISSYSINYGDGKTESKTTAAGSATFEHTYAEPGTYTAQAGVTGILDDSKIGDGVNPTCKVPVVVDSPPVPNYTIKKYVNNKDAQNNNSAVTVVPGEPFNYKVVVKNTGQTDLSNIKAWDALPSGVKYVDGSLKLAGNTVGNDTDFFKANNGVVISSLAVGASIELTFSAIIEGQATQVTDKCNLSGVFYNNVAKADPDGSLPEKQDPAVIKCKSREDKAVDIEKDVTQYQNPVGGSFDWVLKVTNNGNKDLKNVQVTDAAPTGTEFTGAQSQEGVEVSSSANNYNAVIANLKSGQSIDLVINARVTSYVADEITNTACVDAPDITDQTSDPAKDDCDDAKITIPEPCPIPGKETVTKDDAACTDPTPLEPPVTPPVTMTPSTGGGEVIMLAVLALVAGSGIYYYSLRSMKKS